MSFIQPDVAVTRKPSPAQIALLKWIVATNGGGVSAWSASPRVIQGLVDRHMIQGKSGNLSWMVHTKKGLEFVRALERNEGVLPACDARVRR